MYLARLCNVMGQPGRVHSLELAFLPKVKQAKEGKMFFYQGQDEVHLPGRGNMCKIEVRGVDILRGLYLKATCWQIR